jgi:4-oxalocrotonate tautomerase
MMNRELFKMPIIQILLLEGSTIDEKRKLVKSLTAAVVDSLGVQPDSVRIAITEISKYNYAKAGILRSDKK